MKVTDIIFKERSFHRDEKGGYEIWSFNVDERNFELFCDIRIPGIVSSFYEDLPKDTSKVCVVDIIFNTKTNASEVYDPYQSTAEFQQAVSNAVIKILLEEIKPKRNFKYVAFVYSIVNDSFYKNIINSICNDTTDEIKQKVHRIINKDTQLLIDAGQLRYLVGELK